MMSIERIEFGGNLASVACFAATILFNMNVQALSMPTISVTSEAYLAWRDSVNLTVYADTKRQLVEFTLLLEKPAPPDLYWNLDLRVQRGTNLVSDFKLGDVILGPEHVANHLSTNNVARERYLNKTVQRFIFSLSPDMLTNSIVTFTIDDRTLDVNGMRAGSSYIVQLLDLYTFAIPARINTFKKSTKTETSQ